VAQQNAVDANNTSSSNANTAGIAALASAAMMASGV
jgi:hypothetical protein